MVHQKYIFCQSDKNRCNFDWFTKICNSKYSLFLLQSDFLENQVPILVYKDFWYQELSNQMQTYVTWPIRCNSVTWPMYLWVKAGHSHQTDIVVLAVVIFFFDILRKRDHCPWLNTRVQVLHVLKILAAHWLKITGLKY